MVGAAVAFGVIELPIGPFIASVPVLTMLGKGNLRQPTGFVSQVLDGAA